MGSTVRSRIGDQLTSDVVVRLETENLREQYFYCHSHLLTEESKYFADRISDNWPAQKIFDSRRLVEVYCLESEFDHYVNCLHLLYDWTDSSLDDMWRDVKHALGVLQAAVELDFPQIVTACVNYLEAVPWKEAEKDILEILPAMGSKAGPVLARVEPVNPSTVLRVLQSAIQLATSSPSNDIKTSTQEQIKYMLTEDYGTPLLATDDRIKDKMKKQTKELVARFINQLEAMSNESFDSFSWAAELGSFKTYLSDISWACQILSKLEIMKEFVCSWVAASDKIVSVFELASFTTDTFETKLKIIEVAAKVLEAIDHGTVVLSATKRLHMVNVWLPFVRVFATSSEALEVIFDREIRQPLESTFVSMILTLPSEEQANILIEWLENEHIQYPDLSEVFEVWCYRTKVANRRAIADAQGVTMS